ncbi:MAG: glutathione peroxidase [Planctomycetota bacterium]|jgi:glutathione peroxidase
MQDPAKFIPTPGATNRTHANEALLAKEFWTQTLQVTPTHGAKPTIMYVGTDSEVRIRTPCSIFNRPAKTIHTMTTLFQFTGETLQGPPLSLAEFQGKVVLVVNVASRCGFTSQYEGLEALHQKYAHRGLIVLGFPCNQFRSQEPGDAAEIASFCKINFGVTFPMFAKVDVNGPHTAPIFDFLKTEGRGILGTKKVKWNFTKFLVDRTGQNVERFAPTFKPENLHGHIEALLSAE